tara:strand:+ start:2119 stop:3771 length:1653 start_codon:yes stop_codon:yes gene_type:complete
MSKILISSTSFLLQSNNIWKNISKNNQIEFSEYGKIFSSFKSYDIEINLLFLPDIIDYFKSENTEVEIKKISNTIKLIESHLKKTSANIIIGFSDYLIHNNLSYSTDKYFFNKYKLFFVDNLNILKKKYRNLFILDLDLLFANSGFNKSFSQRNFYLMNCRLSLQGLISLSKELSKFIKIISTNPKKVLILDCDNTIWGGVLAEDGFNKIKIGQDGIGKAFSDFQKVAKKIKNNGTLLVLASKNEKSDVKKVLNSHRAMILKDSDITSYKVNWEEKSKNILELSNDLMLGLDSFVFWDDNPIERAKVKKKLPSVYVFEPKADVSDWPKQLSEYQGFMKINSSKEDEKKTIQYKQRDKFLEKKKLFNDELKYLKNIKIKIKKEKVNNSNIDRAVQLTHKTNQFNFTTRRYNHNRILYFNKKNYVTLFNLTDIYGNHGIISLLILKQFKDFLLIDTFLLSCRILGRYVENYILRYSQQLSKKKKLKGVIIQYIKTKRNSPALNFIDSLKILNKLSKPELINILGKQKKIIQKNSIYYLLKNEDKIINSKIYE